MTKFTYGLVWRTRGRDTLDAGDGDDFLDGAEGNDEPAGNGGNVSNRLPSSNDFVWRMAA